MVPFLVVFLITGFTASATLSVRGLRTTTHAHRTPCVSTPTETLDKIVRGMFYAHSIAAGTVVTSLGGPGPLNKNVTKGEEVLREIHAPDATWIIDVQGLPSANLLGIDAIVAYSAQYLWPYAYRQYIAFTQNIDVLDDGSYSISISYTAITKVTDNSPYIQSMGQGQVVVKDGKAISAHWHRPTAAAFQLTPI